MRAGLQMLITDRNWNYFSPTFLISESGDPVGLPQTGSIGGLTNSPAFRDMKGITAARAGDAGQRDKERDGPKGSVRLSPQYGCEPLNPSGEDSGLIGLREYVTSL